MTIPTRIIGIFVTWKRRKGKPVEFVAATSGGFLQAMFLEREVAKKLKVPASWLSFEAYYLNPRPHGEEPGGKANSQGTRRAIGHAEAMPEARMHAIRENSKPKVLRQRLLHAGLSSEKSSQISVEMPALRKNPTKARTSARVHG